MQGVRKLSSSRNDRSCQTRWIDHGYKMFQACFDASPFPATPFPHRYFNRQGSLFRGGLIINLTWPRKRQENSKLISFWILQRVFTSTFRKNVRWRQRVRSHLAFYVSSCPPAPNQVYFKPVCEVVLKLFKRFKNYFYHNLRYFYYISRLKPK